MTKPDNYDEEFRETFLNHLKVIHNMELDRATRTEGRPKIRSMILENKVSRMTVVATMIEGLKLYPDKLGYVVGGLLKHIIDNEPEQGKHFIGAYPELLWLVLASGHLSDRDTVGKMFDLTQDLIRIIGHKLTRSYLNYLVLTGSQEEAKIVIPAYYYTHLDMESLRLIIPFVSYEDINLSVIICTDAVRFVANLREQPLSQVDIDFLIEFFEKGLTSKNPTICEYSKKALEILKKE